MMSIDQVLQKLKDGEDVQLCDIFSAVSLEGKAGQEKRAAALYKWLTSGSGSLEGGINQMVALLESIDGDVTPNPNQPLASISTTGTASTLATLGFVRHANTDSLIIQVRGGNVSMTVNGNNPTVSTGWLIADGTIFKIGSDEIGVARFITSSGTPTLQIAGYLA